MVLGSGHHGPQSWAAVAGFGPSASLRAEAAPPVLPGICVEPGLVLNLYFSRQWFTLDEVCKGKLHVKLEWLTLMPDASALDKVGGPGGWPHLPESGCKVQHCCPRKRLRRLRVSCCCGLRGDTVA